MATNEVSHHNGNWNEVSFHLAVNEVQVLPFYRNAWASGDGANGYGNRNTIHVEICKNYDRNTNSTKLGETQQVQYVKAEANAIKVIAQLCVDLGIVANSNNIKRYYDRNGKWCPSKVLNEGRWNIVQALIIGEYNRLVNGW